LGDQTRRFGRVVVGAGIYHEVFMVASLVFGCVEDFSHDTRNFKWGLLFDVFGEVDACCDIKVFGVPPIP
jgi:hypothetical protein